MTKLAPGTVVKIRDLKSQTQYNGTFGIVSRFVEDQGRYEILSGITSEGNAKPNFQCYFDAEDKTSPINETAEAMASLLPMYELSKISGNYRPIRGPCVLIYSPMKRTFFSSAGGAKTTSMSDDPGRRFSAKELREVLLFHHTKRAKAMYASHDNPMHRMFGGMM